MKYVRTPGFEDGRALFRLADVKGEPVVVWLRVGNHSIYDS